MTKEFEGSCTKNEFGETGVETIFNWAVEYQTEMGGVFRGVIAGDEYIINVDEYKI